MDGLYRQAKALNQIIKDPLIQEFLDTIAEELSREKQELNEKLRAGTNYCLHVVFKSPVSDRLYDEIPLEGFENAMMIFAEYRRIGHSLGLYSLTLTLEDEKIKKLYFKYKS